MMTGKRIIILLILLSSVAITSASFAEKSTLAMEKMESHNMMSHVKDGRISLALSPQMRAQQLANMRSHMVAIQAIVGLLGTGHFDAAAKIAHTKLGLTDEMKKMCLMFNNDNFSQLGFSFHKSADKLGEVLKTRNVNKSLHALQTTMGYCVQCHATFRQ